MLHQIRWTSRKLADRLRLIEPLVYRRKEPLPPFRYLPLSGPLEAPPAEIDVDDSAWVVIEPETYWGTWFTDFVLRTRFVVPADWDATNPIGLYLPLGDSGDFSHPEALAYLDGEAYAACDRHHQEFLLPDRRREYAGDRPGRAHPAQSLVAEKRQPIPPTQYTTTEPTQ